MTRQFFNTLAQIAHSDSVGTISGTCRHLRWQLLRLTRGFPREFAIGSSRLYFDEPNSVAALVNAMGLYDFNNMSFLQSVLWRFGGVFIDIGANVGSYTLIASEIGNCRVLSIEPHPSAFSLLERNVCGNRRTNVVCLNLAASNQEGTASLTDGAELSVNRIVSAGRAADAIQVKTQTLESVCLDAALVPDFIKIDVEGHELCVLEGFRTLASVAKAIWIEGGEREVIRRKLCEAGYAGPYYVHYKEKSLRPTATRRREDPVFILRNFVPLLENEGFRIFHPTANEIVGPNKNLILPAMPRSFKGVSAR